MKKLSFCWKKIKQNESKSIIMVASFAIIIEHIQLVKADQINPPSFSYSHKAYSRNSDDNYERSYFNGSGLAGFLLTDSTNLKLNLSNDLDLKLSNILDRNGPDMRPSSDFTDFDDITIDISKRAWLLMHNHAEKLVLDKLKLIEPILEQTLLFSNVSSNCYEAVTRTIKAAKNLDSWAIQCKLILN